MSPAHRLNTRIPPSKSRLPKATPSTPDKIVPHTSEPVVPGARRCSFRRDVPQLFLRGRLAASLSRGLGPRVRERIANLHARSTLKEPESPVHSTSRLNG